MNSINPFPQGGSQPLPKPANAPGAPPAVAQDQVHAADSEVEALKEQVAKLQELVNKQGASQPQRFSDLPVTQQTDIKNKLETLGKKGRLFRQTEPNGPLIKAEPIDVFNSLERHIGLTWVVEGVGQLQVNSSQSQGTYNYGLYSNEGSSNHRSHTTNYASSPILGWTDLDFVSTDAPGVAGVSKLPKPEGSVLSGFAERSNSSYWAATGWITELWSGATWVTGHTESSQQQERRWNM